MRNVADTGLSILYQMLQNVAQEEAAAQSFYQTYYTEILQHIFSVVTDSSHTAGWYSNYYIFSFRKPNIHLIEICVNNENTFILILYTLGLTMHATILAYMFSLVEMNKITVPLGPNITADNNIVYVQEFLANLLKAAFPHLNE